MTKGRTNFGIPYNTERDGQIEFFENYGVPVEDGSVLIENTDGVYNGNIFEFKLNISNLNKVLFQAIKYLSKLRIKGISVPATILLIDLNATTVYVYKSEDYFDDIHKVYTGAASQDLDGFAAGEYDMKLDYSDMMQSAQVKNILNGHKADPDEMYIPIDIDEYCVVGWADRYYRENPNASKSDFLGDTEGTAIKIKGEIREPKKFKGLINPYEGNNNPFKDVMDKLNSISQKKELGAFYTPKAYAEKACELVKMAIERVPEGNDYIILDRCAGCGALEQAVYDTLGEDVASHIVCSTYEYWEWRVLDDLLRDKVRDIIPPTEANIEFANGLILNADAMSEEYINNPIIKQYVDNPKCTIILFENPPYHDETSNSAGNRAKKIVQKSFVRNMMEKDVAGAALNDLANRFIWAGFKYYLRQPSDSYIVFSPLKYWKSHHITNATFSKGFLFNKAHFHAKSATAISCIMWNNIDSAADALTLEAYDIHDENVCKITDVTVKKVKKTPVTYFDRRKQDDYIAYMNCSGFNLDSSSRGLVRTNNIKGHGSCFFLYPDNYLKKLPLFCMKLFPEDVWYEKDVYYTTSDGGDAYTHDPQFLKFCLIYTCLSNQNKCLSFDGSDGRRYQNELCFDKDALALRDLNKYAADKKTALDEDEKALMKLWYQILEEAKSTANYNPEFNYGVYQITKELNTFVEIETGKSKKKIYDYPDLNGNLETLRTMLKAYYKSHITGKMFEYELLK